MKKHLVTLFVFIYIAAFFFSALTGVVTRAEELPETNSTEDTTLPQTEPSAEEGISALLDMEAKEPEWMSYSDFVLAQNVRTMEDPSIFVGCLAQLNPAWDSVEFAANPAVKSATRANGSADSMVDENGEAYLLKVVDYAIDGYGWLWYKVVSGDERTLPQVLIDTPYVLHLDFHESAPTLLWLPLEGMFLGENVEFKKQNVMASAFVTLPAADLPATFEISHLNNAWDNIANPSNGWPVALEQSYYDLGDVTGWHADLAEKNYPYVAASSVLLISPEVTLACQKLQNAGSLAEFNEIWDNLPDSVKDLILPHQMEQLETRFDELSNVHYETAVLVGEVSVPVTVTGPIPETGITLSATLVSNEQVIEEGFDVKPDASDVITALDIKLLKEDGTEWQPADGQQITVTIGMAELGIADETVVSLHHKHEEDIQKLDIFLVLDGKVTIFTSGMSIYVVSSTTQTNVNNITAIGNGSPLTLTVGQEIIYYFRNGNNTYSRGTWVVEDRAGAIHYTVHTQTAIGHDGMYCPWIRIHALKETTADTTVSLRFYYGDNNNNYESYTIRIVPPTAEAGQKALYLKDDVNATGRLIATLVDDKGVEQSLAGASFKWTRSDKMMISPFAYGSMEIEDMVVSNISVDIARDHGGLVEARMNENKTAYQPTTYTCVATLPDGSTVDASYTVYYQSEIINASFEFPAATNSNYTFFPNGFPELYWETTAPGTGANRTKDIEYGDVTGGTSNPNNGGTGFGVTRAADYSNGGVQFAELNAEEIGALFQDIITAPGEEISWSFSHAPRQKQNWTQNRIANKMFIVIGPTEDAQKLVTQQEIQNRVLNTAIANGVRTSGGPTEVLITEGDVTYKYVVWYHDAGAPGTNDNSVYQGENNGWTKIEGTYEVPTGQYRTRLFFVSDLEGNDHKNFGNLIDKARAGQYKTFLIEYYEETFEAGNPNSTIVHIADKDEKGEALIYSSRDLQNLTYFLEKEHDYLHTILINGKNYPYTIRYNVDAQGNPYPDNQAYLYIENYQGTPIHYDVANDDNVAGNTYYDPTYLTSKKNNYDDYDIVMQIVLRDTVIAVQKILEFPETLTHEQKLKIINDLKTSNNTGYEAHFDLTAVTVTKNNDGEITAITPLEEKYQPEDPTGTAVINQRDPKGQYTGFIALGRNPSLGTTEEGQAYIVTETSTTQITGLELCRVVFTTTMYKYGAANQELIPTEYIEEQIITDKPVPLNTSPFYMKESQKIADIVVKNYYKEKMTKVNYEAVGKGKVQLRGTTGGTVVDDRPSELLAFYSGKAKGADALPGKNAHFVGWYLDEACTQEVTAAYGVYDKENGIFIPNTNIIETDEITFYALFETGSIIINREGGEAGETFTYLVENVNNTNESFYVTLTCNSDGKGSRTIEDVPAGTYRVTEIEDWSWRHPGSATSPTYYNGSHETPLVCDFSSEVSKPNWLSGWSSLWRNFFKKSMETKPEVSQ